MVVNMEDIVDESGERLNSVCSSDNGDTFGDPQLLPRVGDQYQAEIPELMMEYDGLQLMRRSTALNSTTDFPNCSTKGFPIPIKEALEVHVNQDSAVNINRSLEPESSQDGQTTSNDEEGQRLLKLQPVVASDRMNAYFILQLEADFENGNNGCHPLLGSTTGTWTAIENDSFLLGLYIFGKNFTLVKKFVESRNMGEILFHYYGKFYRSSVYIRWSESRKVKARRCIRGEKIFTGWRKHELLSRILLHMSDECMKMLTEVSRRFGEGKLSLMDYVFTLKDMVGASVLVEAVAIGKGKKDLTGTAIDPGKIYQTVPTRPEIPWGKSCSSLTKWEIIKILTGDFRLSKARSSDLFWEAVWPRLLERGWQSEQTRDQGHADSKNSLVFLLPGVEKFLRRKLLKGVHYFDSISDVLRKVAAEPRHLDIEAEEVEVSAEKEECSSDPEGLSNRQRHFYLQPLNSNCAQDSLKFTVVDSSFVCGDELVKVRDLNCIRVDALNVSNPSALSSQTERDTTKDSENEAEANNASKCEMESGKKEMESGAGDLTKCIISTTSDYLPSGTDAKIAIVENHEDEGTIFPNDRQSSETKFQFSQDGKSHQSSNLEPITKQCELTACKYRESSYGVETISIDTKLDGEFARCLSSSPVRCEVKDFLLRECQTLECSPKKRSKEAALSTICINKEQSPEKTQSHTLIDLNQPPPPPDYGTDEPVLENVDSSTISPSISSATIDQPELLNSSNNAAAIEKQPVVNVRRQSTRNRPLSTKALEALAFDSLTPKKKRKGVDSMSKNNPTSKSSSKRLSGNNDVCTSLIDEGEERVDADTNK